MNTYLLLLRSETIDFASYSPEDMQRILADFDAWNASMIGAQRLIASGNLSASNSACLRPGSVVTDGPYAEAREAVTGFFLIQAADLDEARRHASACPFLPRGGSVEVRHVPQLEFEDAAFPIMAAHQDARRNMKEA